jgi:hypothetical protein
VVSVELPPCPTYHHLPQNQPSAHLTKEPSARNICDRWRHQRHLHLTPTPNLPLSDAYVSFLVPPPPDLGCNHVSSYKRALTRVFSSPRGCRAFKYAFSRLHRGTVGVRSLRMALHPSRPAEFSI